MTSSTLDPRDGKKKNKAEIAGRDEMGKREFSVSKGQYSESVSEMSL